MAKLSIVAGATSQSVNIFVQNSSSTTGAGLTGLVFNTSGLIAYYTFTGVNAAATAITLATLAAVGSAYSSGGFKEIDATNMPGVYRLDLPNAAIAAAKGRSVVVYLQGATNMAPCVFEIELTGWDNQDAVHGGMSALPNTACTTNASLLTSGTGTDQISNTSGRVDVGKALGTAVTLDANNVLNVSAKYVGGTLQTARDLGASVLLSAGTGTGQLDFTSGVVKSNLVQIIATALTETIAGQLAGAFKKFFDVTTPVFTCLNINQTGDSFARLGAPAGASHAADVAAVKVDTAAVKVQTDKLAFSVANQVDANVLDWKSATAPAMTGDAFARLGAPAGASVSADVASVKSDSSGLRTDYTTARAGYLDVLNGIVAAIWGAATRTLTAFGFTTGLTTSQVAAAVWDEPTASHQTAGSTGKALTSASAPTAAQVATAVWDEPTASHQTTGSTGKALTSAGAAGDPWSVLLPGTYGAGTAGRIVGGTPNTYTQQGAGDTPFIGR